MILATDVPGYRCFLSHWILGILQTSGEHLIEHKTQHIPHSPYKHCVSGGLWKHPCLLRRDDAR